jgi:hypothetical protein
MPVFRLPIAAEYTFRDELRLANAVCGVFLKAVIITAPKQSPFCWLPAGSVVEQVACYVVIY